MNENKTLQWILRIAVAGEFLGHGALALSGKTQWISWIGKVVGSSDALSAKLLFLIGLLDLAVTVVILIKPIKSVILWAVLWGFWTALLRPIVGESIWDFVERSANWGAPLALYFVVKYRK